MFKFSEITDILLSRIAIGQCDVYTACKRGYLFLEGQTQLMTRSRFANITLIGTGTHLPVLQELMMWIAWRCTVSVSTPIICSATLTGNKGHIIGPERQLVLV